MLELAAQLFSIEPAADKHQPRLACLALGPGAVEAAVHRHVHRLKHEAARLALERHDALGAQQVGTALGHQPLQPRQEAAALEWARKAQRHAGQALAVARRIEWSVDVRSRPGRCRAKLGHRYSQTLDVEGPAVEQRRQWNVAMHRAPQLGRRVDLLHRSLGLGQHGRIGQVGLVEQHQVGLRELRTRFGHVAQLRRKLPCIGHADHAVQPRVLAQQVIEVEGLHHRCRVGQARSLDHDAVETTGTAHQIAGHTDQVAAQLAADAAVVQLVDLVLGPDDKRAVDAEFAVLVDDHRIALALGTAQQTVQQRGLARAKKPGQHGHRNESHQNPLRKRSVVLNKMANADAMMRSRHDAITE